MAKFDLSIAKQNALAMNCNEMTAGYHRVVIQEVAEVGLFPAYNQIDPPQSRAGFVFENAAGIQIAKIMPLHISPYSNLGKLLAVIDDVNELKDMIGQQLVLEIEVDGKWPKITGFSHVDDGLSNEQPITPRSDTKYYNVDEPDPTILKQLHPQLKQAVSTRIRQKGD